MTKHYPCFFVVLLLFNSITVISQELYSSLNHYSNTPDTVFKKEILVIARGILEEEFIKLGKDFDKKIENVGVDFKHQVFKQNQEINNIKENLIQQGFTLKTQTRSYSDTGQENDVLTLKLVSLEERIKQVYKDTERETKVLKRKLYILENENRMLSSRVDATQMTLIKMTSPSPLTKTYSNKFVAMNVVQKLETLNDRLNGINNTLQNVCNTSVMTGLVDTFQSEVNIVKQSTKALNIDVNATLDNFNKTSEGLLWLTKSMQLNFTKIVYDTELHISKELRNMKTNISALRMDVRNLSNFQTEIIHDLSTQTGKLRVNVRRLSEEGQHFRNKLNAFEDNFNITMSVVENIKYQQQEISFKLMDTMLQNSLLSDALNTTEEDLVSFRTNLSKTLNDFENQTHFFCKREFDDLQSNIFEATKMNVELRTALKEVLSDHQVRSRKIQNLNQNVSRLQSDIELLKYEQNKTKSNISEIKMTHNSNASTLQQLVNACIMRLKNFQSAHLENNLRIKQLQHSLMIIQSNTSQFQTLIGEYKLKQENATFYINKHLDDNVIVENSVRDLTNNFTIFIQNAEDVRHKINDLTLEWTLFLKGNDMEAKAIKQQIESTSKYSKILRDLIEAYNVSCETNINDLKITLKQFGAHFSLMNDSVENLQQEIISLKLIQEWSDEKISNLSTTVQEIYFQINNTDELLSLSEAITDLGSRLTHISSEMSDVNNDQNVVLSLYADTIRSGYVRLVGGTTANNGRVEVWYDGGWGTVCDDSWDSDDAKVICRMLGFTGNRYYAYSGARFGQGSGTIVLDEVQCTGSEYSIFSCSHGGYGKHNCGHYEDASVRCT